METILIPYLPGKIPLAEVTLVIAPHPDDEVFGCGGAIMRHLQNGKQVKVIIISVGGLGVKNEEKAQLIAQREAESGQAAIVLGYGRPEFWHLPDGGIVYGEALIRRIVDEIQNITANLVYAPSPLEMHPDHRAVAMCVIEAVRRTPSPPLLALYEVGVPLPPNLLLDISDLAGRKMTAMECFVSQNKKQRYDLDIAALNRYRTYTLPAEVTAAEAYILVSAEELAHDPFRLYQSEHQRQRKLGLALDTKDVPLVSVIIRSMDRLILSEALDSVALQTYSNIEVIVVNAKGEAHSKLGEWCGNFPLRMVDTGEMLRRSRAGNVGLSNAHGDYLIFLDDDDWFMPEHVFILMDALIRNPDKKVAYSCVKGVNEQKRPIGQNFCHPFDRTRLLAGNYIPIHAVLFSRTIVDGGCRMDESFDLYEDWDFWLQAAAYADFIFVDHFSAYYRIGGGFGQGVKPDMVFARQISANLFEKWHKKWGREDLLDIMDRVRGREVIEGERDAVAAERDTAVAERNRQIDNLKQVIEEIYKSSSWRITAPMRQLSLKAKDTINLFKLLPSIFRIGGGMAESAKKAWRVFLREGWAGVKRRILFVSGHRSGTSYSKIRPDMTLATVDRNDYTEWLRRYDTLTDADREKIKSKIARFQTKPLISVVMPVYNPPVLFLEQAIQSVRNQLYPNWELCIADDASTNPVVREMLERHCKQDCRIKVVYREQNGHISCASNSALELVQGEFTVLFDHDDLLAEHALYWVVDAINQHPDAGLIYSDEDKIDESNRRYDPYFKCELNYELLLAQNMVSHLGVYRTDVVRDLGGFRVGFEGSQDYDLVLRVIEKLKPKQVIHIPRILYHWRAIAGSTALAAGEKNYAAEAGRKAVADHLKRMGIAAEVMPAPELPTLNRVRFSCPSPQPLVSIIIPTRDRADLLGMCLDSLIQRTTYNNYEVIIVDNGSVEAATQQLFGRLPKDRFRILRDESPFNFSALNNKAARLAGGELLCLMNNDIEILTPDWLEEMVSFAVRTDIGCVGARLWYPEGGLQHGGILLGVGGVGNHAHYKIMRGNPGYFARAFLHQSFSALTGACLLVQRHIFDALGGLDEQLVVAFNDVDFCLRVRDAGYRNVWTPYAEMNHHESASRGIEDTSEKQIRFFNEVSFMQSRWNKKLLNDPAYNPNLTLDYEDFSYAWPPRVDAI